MLVRRVFYIHPGTVYFAIVRPNQIEERAAYLFDFDRPSLPAQKILALALLAPPTDQPRETDVRVKLELSDATSIYITYWGDVLFPSGAVGRFTEKQLHMFEALAVGYQPRGWPDEMRNEPNPVVVKNPEFNDAFLNLALRCEPVPWLLASMVTRRANHLYDEGQPPSVLRGLSERTALDYKQRCQNDRSELPN